ncbi:MAG: bifunctional UDP-N-acetylmuramoyl-tripeptide:D-alanyl-D-alanine ligase/alanine racemase [Bacteroidales bacterium]|nr:bifunctional UDP-N-acetylmuramoyl-tripeptide:D-alanyl-D-alanine ligase/alanine racemase [Bacteroidales bacterium]
MLNYSTQNISNIVKGQLFGKKTFIKYLLIDSRNIVSEPNSLFFAIVGNNNDGHNFINDLYKNNVNNFVVSTLPENYEKYKNANFILVDNTLTALQQLATFHRNQFNIPVVGITGSNGKTIIKEWLFQTLQNDKKIIRSPKSYNSQVGVPLSVWLLNKSCNFAIFEAGISEPQEMKKIQPIINPSIGIFTNIGDAHQENFIDLKQKISEKIKLFYSCNTIIYRKDYKLIDYQFNSDNHFSDKKLVTWSIKQKADLQITNINKKNKHSLISAKYENKNLQIEIPFIDDASIENAIHVWLLMLLLNFDNKNIEEKMYDLSPVAMRLELKQGINNCSIINDSYNSDIQSLTIALDFLNHQKQNNKNILILSDILQSSFDEKELYKKISELVREKNIDEIIGIGKTISRNSNFFSIKKHFFSSTDDFAINYSKNLFINSNILIKGSRKFHFEKISTLLEKKIHRTVLEVNLNAIEQNLNFFRSKLRPETKIMAMVKAFSYGSGTFEIASLLQYQNINYLAAAYTDEGIELRKNQISLPIVIMNPEVNSFNLMIEYKLEPEIYNFRTLRAFHETLIKNNKKTYPIHIKLDTGMHRSGFDSNDIDDLINELKEYKNLKIKSIFSHLAASDEKIHDDFTNKQFSSFELMTSKIINEFDYPILRHILNSSGIERFPKNQYDMVRLGIGLYGISPSKKNKLFNVSTLKSIIAQIRTVKKNETVGYGRKGKLDKDSKIATVPIGYADGLRRQLSNGVGKVLVNNQFAPIIGNICMDICMIDITKVNAKEGDEVIFFGNDYPVTELAKQLNTIPYEILTSISNRVKRVYFHE